MQQLQDEFNRAVNGAEFDRVLVLIEQDVGRNLNLGSQNDWAIGLAAAVGRLDVVNRLLLEKERRRGVNVGAGDNYAIEAAAREGHLDIVNRLLLERDVDPAASNNRAIRQAAFGVSTRLKERLVSERGWEESATIRAMMTNGNLNVLNRLLLQRDDAILTERLGILNRLVDDRRVRNTAIEQRFPLSLEDYTIIRMAFAQRRHAIIVVGQIGRREGITDVIQHVAEFVFGETGERGMDRHEVRWALRYHDEIIANRTRALIGDM